MADEAGDAVMEETVQETTKGVEAEQDPTEESGEQEQTQQQEGQEQQEEAKPTDDTTTEAEAGDEASNNEDKQESDQAPGSAANTTGSEDDVQADEDTAVEAAGDASAVVEPPHTASQEEGEAKEEEQQEQQPEEEQQQEDADEDAEEEGVSNLASAQTEDAAKDGEDAAGGRTSSSTDPIDAQPITSASLLDSESQYQTSEMGTDPIQSLDGREASASVGSYDRLKDLHAGHKRYKVPRHPLDLNWAFGFNTSNPTVHLIEDGTRSDVVFCSGHAAVVLHKSAGDQSILLGHRFAITTSCASGDGKWLATADAGDDATLIVWDTATNLPIRTYFKDQIGLGVQAACFSHDALLLIVVITKEDGSQQARVFEWTNPDATAPVASADLDALSTPIVSVTAHPTAANRAVANTTNEALFLSWASDELEVQTIANESKARLTASAFLPDELTAVSGNVAGEVIMWSRTAADQPYSQLKRIQASPAAVNTLCLTPDSRFLVLGCGDGCVRCFDHQCRALGWNEDLESGAITAIAFATAAADDDLAHLFAHDDHSQPTPETFSQALPNFVVSTSEGLIVNIITGAEFMPTVVLNSHTAGITDIAVHPSSAMMVSASSNGALQIWNYEKGEHILTRTIASVTPTALAFSRDGHTLAIGYENGVVDFRDAMTLDLITDSTTIPAANAAVLQVAFAHTNEFAAAAFADSAVGLFKIEPADFESPWELVGRSKAHVGGVTQVFFEESEDSKHRCCLFSIGKDGMMVSYDLDSTFDTQLQIHEPRLRLAQGTYPLAMTDYTSKHDEEFRITANADYKLKLYNKSTNMCRATLLGPIYGDPVRHLVQVPKHPDHLNHQIIAFANSDKVGLCLAPVDGNPHRYIAILAHPDEITCLRVSHDGKFLFTAGANAGSVHMWQLNPAVLAATVQTRPQGMDALYELVEGGRDGDLINDMKEYFYYAQIRRHGITSMAPLQASDTLPLEDVPDVLRAVGFFPTEHQIAEMNNEIKFKDYFTTREYKTTVDLDDLVTLLVNHRPALGLAPSDLHEAFAALVAEGDGSLDSAAFYELLQEVGDRMTEDELARCLASLLGDSRFDEALPPRIDADVFAEEIVGFEV
ncbi:hypothetical protein PTSG_06702 [Salpingoeca rosetta]|uniref:Cilia- and flagella-associated protein 251 n=1 Tax=Salpingoeca rosetta (strain ATCC 50818 / BSB-021) TaxID=946362 RepID=F2UEJ5_SALR5|nr:uncharacterized protein PTSG_06702 [Salpingoeca rosetta]EGD75045.1 hypothetical protein PTSG_06702 [Salpingoeca rosetta]|eukprot:XP_004992098.1 hypothetical protein PTSG_06702 [Salpingoeca rosetta]